MTSMNVKMSLLVIHVICIQAITYLFLYNLKDYTFKIANNMYIYIYIHIYIHIYIEIDR